MRICIAVIAVGLLARLLSASMTPPTPPPGFYAFTTVDGVLYWMPSEYMPLWMYVEENGACECPPGMREFFEFASIEHDDCGERPKLSPLIVRNRHAYRRSLPVDSPCLLVAPVFAFECWCEGEL